MWNIYFQLLGAAKEKLTNWDLKSLSAHERLAINKKKWKKINVDYFPKEKTNIDWKGHDFSLKSI